MKREKPKDSVFFELDPSIKGKPILLMRLGPKDRTEHVIRTTDEAVCRVYGKGRKHLNGTVIPVSLVKPFSDFLLNKGLIPRNNPAEAARAIGKITDTLISKQTYSSEVVPIVEELTQEYGHLLLPLTCTIKGDGSCREWTGLATAIGRAAGYEVRVKGHPNFFSGGGPGTDYHVWPVVLERTETGELIEHRVGTDRSFFKNGKRLSRSPFVEQDMDKPTNLFYEEHPIPHLPEYTPTLFELGWHKHREFEDFEQEAKRLHEIQIKARKESGKFKDVGRNDPCPCGSGKKYKKCCMRK